MDEQPQPIEEVQNVKPAKKPILKTILLIVGILVLAGLAAGGAYWWRDKTASDFEKKQADDTSSLKKTIASLETQLADAKNQLNGVSDTDVTCESKSPTDTVIGSIKASITSGNTAALEGYMAASVNVVLAASEGIGSKTSSQAVASISDFISKDISSWNYDFSLPASVLSSYGKGSYSQYFPGNAVVGKAANKQVISFSFDCNAKISTVFMAASEDLLK